MRGFNVLPGISPSYEIGGMYVSVQSRPVLMQYTGKGAIYSVEAG